MSYLSCLRCGHSYEEMDGDWQSSGTMKVRRFPIEHDQVHPPDSWWVVDPPPEEGHGSIAGYLDQHRAEVENMFYDQRMTLPELARRLPVNPGSLRAWWWHRHKTPMGGNDCRQPESLGPRRNPKY